MKKINKKSVKKLKKDNKYKKVVTSKKKLQTILDSSINGIMSFDAIVNSNEIVDFLITYSNAKACEILSYSPEEIIGQRLSIILPGNFIALNSLNGKTLFEVYKEVVKTGKPKVFEFYFAYGHLEEWFRVKVVKYNNGFTVAFSIITKEKELEEQSSLALKGVLLEAITHQWRQPLAEINSILFKAHYLIKNDNSNDILCNELNKIEQLTEFLSNTLEDFQRTVFDNAQTEFFSLNMIVENMIFLLMNSLKEKEVQIINNLENNIMLNSYAKHLKHVLFAIFQNSLEAFEEVTQNEKFIMISSKYEKNFLIISIRDNAGGIDDKNILRIFEKKFTTKKTGTGIGLFISNLIVSKLLKGSIKVQNIKFGVQVDIAIKVKEL